MLSRLRNIARFSSLLPFILTVILSIATSVVLLNSTAHAVKYCTDGSTPTADKCKNGADVQEYTAPSEGAPAPRSIDPAKDCSVVTRDWLCADAQKGGKNATLVVISSIANYMIILFGSVAVLLILWYIIRIIASAGSSDEVAGAKKHLAQVAVSLGLLIAAYAIIQLVGISVNTAP